MIYANEKVPKITRTMKWGDQDYFAMGENGRGRREILLSTNVRDAELKHGLNPGFSIGMSKNGRPRVDRNTDNEMYLLLSSQGGYTRRGDGYISVPIIDEDRIDVLAVGNGADGDAGRIGQWACCLLKVPTDKDLMIRITKSGSDRENEFLLIHENAVYEGNAQEILDACDRLDVKCSAPLGDGGRSYDYWTTVSEVRSAVRYQTESERIVAMIKKYPYSLSNINVGNIPGNERPGFVKDFFEQCTVNDRSKLYMLPTLKFIAEGFGKEIMESRDLGLLFCGLANRLCNDSRTDALKIFESPAAVKVIETLMDRGVVDEYMAGQKPHPGYYAPPYTVYGLLYDGTEHPSLAVQKACAMYGYSDVSKSGEFLSGIRELPKEEKLQLFNVNKALVNEVGFSEDELCELVLKDRELIAKINNPSEKVLETLVTNMPGSRTIELIGEERLTPKLQMLAVTHDTYKGTDSVYWHGETEYFGKDEFASINAIRHPTREVQEWIAENHPGIIYRLKELEPDIMLKAFTNLLKGAEAEKDVEFAVRNQHYLAREIVDRHYGDEGLAAVLAKAGYLEPSAVPKIKNMDILSELILNDCVIPENISISPGISLNAMVKLFKSGRCFNEDELLTVYDKAGHDLNRLPHDMIIKMYHDCCKPSSDKWLISPQELIAVQGLRERAKEEILNDKRIRLCGDPDYQYYDRPEYTMDEIASYYIRNTFTEEEIARAYMNRAMEAYEVREFDRLYGDTYPEAVMEKARLLVCPESSQRQPSFNTMRNLYGLKSYNKGKRWITEQYDEAIDDAPRLKAMRREIVSGYIKNTNDDLFMKTDRGYSRNSLYDAGVSPDEVKAEDVLIYMRRVEEEKSGRHVIYVSSSGTKVWDTDALAPFLVKMNDADYEWAVKALVNEDSQNINIIPYRDCMPEGLAEYLIGVAREKHVAIGIDAARELGMPVEWDNGIDGEDAGDL